MGAFNLDHIHSILHQSPQLIKHIQHRLYENSNQRPVFPVNGVEWRTASAVLFLLGRYPGTATQSGGPCLILNKRSAKVRQPGDLCCPGGRVSPRLDAGLAKLLRWPILPLARWRYWPEWCESRPQEAMRLRLLLATGLRESVEEMRLNPFGLKFLGPLPHQPLVMFKRVIYPLVFWVAGQTRFYPNWEVEKVVRIPLCDFFKPSMYARYLLRIETPEDAENESTFPCFRHANNEETEILWGATFRITMDFLKRVFGFLPPDIQSLPEIRGHLSRAYLNNS